jgi:DUF1680 family protein
MFLVTGEARFMDVLELTLFNSVICGSTLDGSLYSYTNPLRALEEKPAPLRYGGGARSPFVSSFCCPPNLARTVAETHGYAYSTSNNTVWINLYGSSTLTTTLVGEPVKLTQETDYPWSGDVKITVNECSDTSFALKLRIPEWARSASVRLNGESVEQTPVPGTYLELHHAWCAGDVVELTLPMPPQLMEAHPLVEESLHQVAVKRGPLVYCLESADLPPDMHLMEVTIPADIDLTARYDEHLLGGVTVLEGQALARPTRKWKGPLYRELQVMPAKPIEVRLIPYFAWGNRGPSEMTVWLPLSEQ